MKNDPPNAAQMRWREAVRKTGSILSGRKPVHIHHCAGRTAKHNKVAIGHWWLLPLTDDEHRAIHAQPKRKELEKELFSLLVRRMAVLGDMTEPLPPMEVIEAIEDYHR